MTVEELLTGNRSYRRFDESHSFDEKTLVGLVDLVRLCPSAANRQPLKFMISWTPGDNAKIFPHLRWAAALTDWEGPAEGERPTGYVVILGDTRIFSTVRWDDAIVAQSMLLGAVEQGLGGCMIGSIDRDSLRAALDIPQHLDILLILALGKPAETIVLEHGTPPDDTPYWRDADGVHHVPKRSTDEVLLEF